MTAELSRIRARRLADVFEQYYHEAIAAGYSIDDYRNPEVFGEFNKQSQNTSGNKKENRSSNVSLAAW
ncbi:hypothetical protein O1V64_21855 [Rouxiella badensis]|nr:hypothetical protein O1V64_21855 [Rouxiella badensis]